MAEEKKAEEAKKEDQKKEGQAPKEGSGAKEPETEAKMRVEELKREVKELRGVCASLEGMANNRDPKDLANVEAKNTKLKNRLDSLYTALMGLMIDSRKPRNKKEAEAHLETIRKSAVRLFSHKEIDTEKWKDIAS
jgi:ribosomal protein L22